MAEKAYKVFDTNQFNVSDHEDIFSKQKQITFSLRKDVLYYTLQGISELITKSIVIVVSRNDEPIKKTEDGGEITVHGIEKYKIFKRLLILDQILRLDHYQELYDHTWEFDESVETNYDPFVEEGSEKDFYQRHMSIFEALYLLADKEGIVPYPSEVKRFCDKLRSMYSEDHWKQSQEKFWNQVGQHFRAKQG